MPRQILARDVSDNGDREARRTLPPDDRMYRAVAESDAEFEGIFVVAVKTTGIFCRPTCRAKKPRRENVLFFADAQAALLAGFRPCKRCRPMDGPRPRPAVVDALLALVEERLPQRIRDEDLRTARIEPSTARRAFQRHCGMTFHAYERARRLGVALGALRDGAPLLHAPLEAGYESHSGFQAAFAKQFGAPPGAARNGACLWARRIETRLGAMLAVSSERGLCLLEFCDTRGLERALSELRRRLRANVALGEHAHLASIERELRAYFAGQSGAFRTPLDVSGSPFQMRVWNRLREIELGRTRSYAEIAASVRAPGGQRAVGRANGQNRIAIVIPCHRVVRSDGTLCGYGGGVWRKRWLIDHERAMAQS